jgi:glycosyltransferase involved in cell wall biosynthesis
MMVKNEARNLPRLLESVRGLWDEFICVDTGSVDNSVDILRAEGARVVISPWRENFSYHRNEGLDLATKDWVLVLDADEMLGPETKEMVREVVAAVKDDFDVISFVVRSFTAFNNFAQADSPRMFRRSAGFRWTRRCHNELGHNGKIARSPIILYHFGYALSEVEMIKKYKYRLKLLKLDLDKDREDPVTWHHLAVSHRAAREFEPALACANAAVKIVREKKGRLEMFSWTMFIGAICLHFLGRLGECKQACLEGLKVVENMDFYWLLSVLAYEDKNYGEAASLGKKWLSLREKMINAPATLAMHYDTANMVADVMSMVQDSIMRTGGFDGLLREISDGIGQDQEDSQGDAGQAQAF